MRKSAFAQQYATVWFSFCKDEAHETAQVHHAAWQRGGVAGLSRLSAVISIARTARRGL
jgi:hypothetical protein